MEQIMNYVKPELLVVAIVLYFIGVGLKKSETVKDKYIPLILGACGIGIAGVWVVGNCTLLNMQDIAMAVFTAIVQGILVAGLSTYVNQVIKQLNKEGLKINYNELLNVTEYLKIVVYISHIKNEEREEFIFDKTDSLHRIVEFLICTLEKKYVISFNTNSIKEVLEVSEEELQSMIQQGLLNDGYSLSAFMFYQNQRRD